MICNSCQLRPAQELRSLGRQSVRVLGFLGGSRLAIRLPMDLDAPSTTPVGKELTRKIIGVFFLVYNELGAGFPEFVYRRALVVALRASGMIVQEEVALPVWFRGERLATFRADMLVDSSVLMEVRASPELDDLHGVQLLNYLRASDVEIGLLLNFGKCGEFRRMIFDNVRKGRRSAAGADQRGNAGAGILTME